MNISKFGALAAALCLPITAASAETLTFSHFVPTGHRVHAGAQMWAQSIEEASGGRLDVRIFPAQQLGKAVDHYDMIANGQVSAAWFVPGYSAGRFPVVEAGELPFLVTDAAAGARVLHEWYAPVAQTEMDEIRFCAFVTHDPGRIHTRRPVSTPDDLVGVKMRPANAAIGRYLSDIGALPVRLAAPEARQAVERGVVDGVTFPWNTVVNFGLADDLRYHVDLPLYVPMALYGINPRFYEGLDDDLKAVIDDHCTPEWSARLSGDWADWEKEGREVIAGLGGHEFITITGDALQPWIDASAGVYKAWAKGVAEAGAGDADALLSDLRKRLQDADAGS